MSMKPEQLRQTKVGKDPRNYEKIFGYGKWDFKMDYANKDNPQLKPKKRIRQSSKPLMNKLETEFYNRIKDQYPNYPPVRAQAKTFRLANGVRFTPDLTCSIWPDDNEPAKETAWEVKGKHAWDDSICKLKMAASAFPEVRWFLCWKSENGSWILERVMP